MAHINPTLPTVGASTDTWGTENNTVHSTVIGKVNSLDDSVAALVAGTAPDATATSKGVVQLAGDLAGTAANPTLKTVNTGAGTVGSATEVPVITRDAQGRITAWYSVPIPAVSAPTTNSQSGTAYTITASDIGNKVEMTSSSANIVTVPANSSVAFPTGSEIIVRQYGTGQTTIAAAPGVTLRFVGGAAIASQYGAVLLERRGTDEWILSGQTAPSDTTPPSVPTGVTATPSSGQVALSWSASTDSVGVAGYRVRRGGTLIASPTSTTYTDTGLTNGTSYSYTVSAYDAVGNESAQSSTVSATPTASATVPGAPTGLTATAGSQQVSLGWSAPGSNGGSAITDYIVQYSTDGSTWTTFSDGTSTTTSTVVTGLTSGTAYSFRVAAINTVGTGAYSSTASATPTAPFLPFTEAFTGLADGSSWSSPPWSSGSGATGGSATVQSNAGYLTTSGTTGSSWRKTLSGMPYTTGDVEVTFTLQFAAASNAQVFRVYVSTNLSSGAPSENGYFVDLNFTTTNTVDISWSRVTSGTVGALGTSSGNALGIAPTASHKIHIQRTGTTLRARVWNAANTEPSTWMSSVVDPNSTQPTGVVSLMTYQNVAVSTTAIVDDINVF